MEAVDGSLPGAPSRTYVLVRTWTRGVLFACVFAAVLVLFWLKRPTRTKSLGQYGPVPAFVMHDQTGKEVTEKDFRGSVFVADFIFLRCDESCPMLTSRMANLARELEGTGVRFASFSLDPENDTPEELATYATKWHAEPGRWSFLTGPVAEMQRVVSAGFKVGYTRMGDKDGIPNIQHGNWLVLVDAEGNQRGYFRADDESDRKELAAAARMLAAAAKKK
ncbi:MAG: SCO family protein [Polyangiaceae bacterium]